MNNKDYFSALDFIFDEIVAARKKFPAFRSAHEGYAVLLEEVDELWEEIKAKRGDRMAIRTEARQVAAMAVCLMVEVTT